MRRLDATVSSQGIFHFGLIVFVTADYQRAAEGCEDAADILTKPVRYPALVEAVATALSGTDRWH